MTPLGLHIASTMWIDFRRPDVYSQILTSEVDPRTERVKQLGP